MPERMDKCTFSGHLASCADAGTATPATRIFHLIELSGNLGIANMLSYFIELSVHRRDRFRFTVFVNEVSRTSAELRRKRKVDDVLLSFASSPTFVRLGLVRSGTGLAALPWLKEACSFS
jgi:hypothetical protein